MDIEQIRAIVQSKLQSAEQYFQQELDPLLDEAYKIYNADPDYYRKKFPILSQAIGDIQTADVASKVEWALPSLLRIFFGSDDVISVKGRTAEDDEKAEKIQALINWQLTVQNQGFMTFYRWFKDALVTGYGYVKCYWERIPEWREHEEIVEIANAEIYRNNSSIKDFEILEDFGNGLVRVRYKVKYLKKNQPVLEHVPVWELCFIPDGRYLHECSFVAHRKVVTADYLRRKAKEGIYQNVEEAIRAGSEDPTLSQTEWEQDRAKALGYTVYEPQGEQDEGNRKITIYECYTKLDINGDGLLEDVIVTLANGVVLRVQENIYRRPPFFLLSPVPDLHRVGGKGFAQLIGQYQHIKTALIRQMLLSLALSNEPKLLVDPAGVHIEDLISNKRFVRRKPTGTQRPVEPLYQPGPNSQSFSFLEFTEVQLENESGITRYSQGLDARSLNKTATGIQLIMNASNQRLEMIARIFAETGIRDLFRFLIELNQRFIDQAVVIRLLNSPLEITPDDLTGEFDLVVNAGVGIASKQETLQTLQQVLQLQLQLMDLGIVTPKNIYNTVKKLFEELGYKNVEDFLTMPEVVNAGGAGQVGGVPPEGEAGGGMLQLLERLVQGAQGEGLSGMANGSGEGVAPPEGST